jgi:prenyltransferase beta subunit
VRSNQWYITKDSIEEPPAYSELAILSLCDVSVSPIAINQAIQFLLLVQNADGGWGNAVSTISRTKCIENQVIYI